MVKGWLNRYKAQLCAFAVALALLLATVCGEGLSARAEKSADEPLWEADRVETLYLNDMQETIELTIPIKVDGVEKVAATGYGRMYARLDNSHGVAMGVLFCEIDLIEYIDMGLDDFVVFSNSSSVSMSEKKLVGTCYRFELTAVNGMGNATKEDFKATLTNALPLLYLNASADNMTEVSQLEVPEKEGYHFIGWYKDAEFTQPFVSEYVRGDLTLYPKFEINTYTVSFSTGYGSAVKDMTVEHGSTIELPTSMRTGYDFICWTTADGETFDSETEITGDLRLFAKFTIKTFKVTFLNPDGTVFKEVTVNYGTKLVTAAENAKIDYKVFYSEEGQKLAKSAEITENAEVIIEDMTKTEKRAEFMSRHFWLIWAGVALLGVLVITSAVSITVAVKRR